MGETILSARTGNRAEITLNRTVRLNSFTDEMHHALRAALEEARDGSAFLGKRALVFRGT